MLYYAILCNIMLYYINIILYYIRLYFKYIVPYIIVYYYITPHYIAFPRSYRRMPGATYYMTYSTTSYITRVSTKHGPARGVAMVVSTPSRVNWQCRRGARDANILWIAAARAQRLMRVEEGGLPSVAFASGRPSRAPAQHNIIY